MSMIYIINRQTDRIIGHLNNRGDKVFKDDLHVRDLSTGENTFTFTMAAKIKQAALFNQPITLAIRKEEGDFAEFIPFQGHTIDNWTKVFGIASYVDIETQKTIPPGKYSGSLRELAGVALDGCDHELGTVEYVGSRTITIEDSMGPYSFLSKLKQEFEVEMDVRMKTSGPRIRKRYIDFYKRIGRDTNKEIRRGKDLLRIERLINNDRIITALQVEGPKRADGTRLSVMVSDEAAFQRWNVKGKHRIKIYRPATDNQDITVEELERLGEIELKKYIDTIFIYILTAKDIGRLFEHERLWLGDRCRAVDEEFSPPLYADARAIRVERSISDTTKKVVKIGEVVTYTEDEIFQKFLNLQLAYGTRVIKSPTPPAGDSKIIWIKTEEGSDFEVAHTWNGSEWIPITPTRAEQIGAETPEGAQEKAEEEARKAKEYAESRAEYERLQGHAVQLLTEKNGYEQQYLDAYHSPTLYTESIKTNLYTTWNAYLTAFNNLYNAITTAASDETITQAERDDVETKTIAYRAAVTNFTAAHAAAVKDIAAGLAKDAEEAATDYYEEFGQKKITQGLVAPSNPVTGDLWIDTSGPKYVWKQWNGTEWKPLTPTDLSQLNGQIVGSQLADGVVEAAKIKDGAVTGPKIVDGVITAPKIGNLAIDSTKIAQNAVTAEKVFDGAITAPKIGNLAIDSTKIAPNAVTTEKLVDGVVSNVKIGNLAVDATKLANNAFTTAKILDGAIADAKIAAGAVTSGKIFDGAITNVKLAALAVDAAKLADGAVTGVKVALGAITESKLADLAVIAAKLADGAVTDVKLGAGAVTNAKLANLAVDAAKLAAGAVVDTKIATGAITNTKLADLAVDAAKLANSSVTATKIANLAVGSAAIADAAITNAKLDRASVNKIIIGTADISDAAINSAKIGLLAVGTAAIQDTAITNAKIANLGVTTAKIDDAAITSAKIANLAVGTAAIANGAITTAKIGNAQITSALIGDAQITAAKIAALAVGTAAIQDAAITNAKVGALDASKITTGVLDAGRVQIGAGTSFAAGYDPTTKATPADVNSAEARALAYAESMQNGKILHPDPTFKSGVNSVLRYNNANNGNVTVTRVEKSAEAPTTSTHMLRVTHTGTASPGLGGVYQGISARPDAIFVIKMIAKIPVGYNLFTASNLMGTGYTDMIVSSNEGTGRFEEYIRVVKCGTTGTFSSGGHWYLAGGTMPTVAEPLVWDIAQMAAVDVTDFDYTAIESAQRLTLWQYADTTFIDGGNIYTNTITANQIAAGTITAAEIAGSTITGSKIAAGTITASNISTDTITAAQIASNAITANELAADSVTAGKILAGSVSADKIAVNAVTAVKIAAGSIETDKLGVNAVTADKIATNSITALQIATNAITADELSVGAVKAVNIEAGAVKTDALDANAVTAVKIAAGSIEAAKIATDAITADKIAANSITASELAANSVTADAILAGSITAVKIAANAIESDKIAANAITTGKIQASGVTATNIAAGAITASKLAVASQNMLWDIDTFEQYPEGAEPNGSVGGSTNRVVSEVPSPLGKMVLKHVSTTTNSYKYLAPAPYTSHGWARVQNGKRYILSAYVMTTSAVATTVNLAAVAREFGSGTSATSGTGTGSLSLSAADDWKRISVLAPTVSGTDPAYALYARNASAGVTTYWTGFQLEEYNGVDATPSPFVPGGSVYIHGGNIAANSVTASQIAANTITASQIAANTITSSLIATAGLDAGVIKFGTMDGSRIQAETITATQIAANAITASELAANAVVAANVAAGAITTDKLAAGAITADKISAGAITSDKILAGTLTGITIVGGSITSNSTIDVTTDLKVGNAITIGKTSNTSARELRLVPANGIGGGLVKFLPTTDSLEIGALNGVTLFGLTVGLDSSVSQFNLNSKPLTNFAELKGRYNGGQVLADFNNGTVVLNALGSNLVLGLSSTALVRSDATLRMGAGKYLETNAVDNNPGDSGANMYIRPASGGEVRATVTGTTGTYTPMRASAFNNGSSREYKTNIEDYPEIGLETLLGLSVKKYDLIADVEQGITNNRQIGLISEDSACVATPDGKAINTYKLLSLNVKATQELHQIIKTLQEEIELLKRKVA